MRGGPPAFHEHRAYCIRSFTLPSFLSPFLSLFSPPQDRQCVVDLRPFMNTAPYCINETASVVRTYRLFRTMGLRHLCVINSHNQVSFCLSSSFLPSFPPSLLASVVRTY